MDMTSNDDLDINLKSTVMLALSKLQKLNKTNKKQKVGPVGVTCKKLVEFLKAHHPWVDGDVESQVMTALLSFVKTGTVCALDNRQYLLLVPSAKNMISKCVSRVSHGPKCSCLLFLKSLMKTLPICCLNKPADGPVKKLKKSPRTKPVAKPALKPQGKLKPPSARKGKVKKKGKPVQRKPKRSCAQKAQSQIGTSKSDISICADSSAKCNYCFEMHSQPKLRKLCMTCYPVGKSSPVPSDTFSPRDESRSGIENVIGIVEKP